MHIYISGKYTVVALCETQTNYDKGGSSLMSGDEVWMLGTGAPR